jgi:ABC-type spermidine/putrescine transport system permease subunit II
VKSLLFKVSSILVLIILYIPIIFMAGSVFANNEIYITQVGTSDNLTIDITQDGDDNVVQFLR